ncbi:AAA family ATPase, partial [Streptomyces sp. NPDC001450]
MDDPEQVRARLEETGYLVDEGLGVTCFLALRLHRPLFCEGDAGVGKTALATALAEALDAPLIRLQCHEGIDASQALYDWDFPRQLLHLRAAEAGGGGGRGGAGGGGVGAGRGATPARPAGGGGARPARGV